MANTIRWNGKEMINIGDHNQSVHVQKPHILRFRFVLLSFFFSSSFSIHFSFSIHPLVYGSL